MLLFGPNLLFFCFVVTLARDEVNLEIIKNENGIATSLSSFLEARNGANFSLECQVVDSKSGKKLNDAIIWERQSWKLKFGDDIKMSETTVVGSTMTFIPVSVKNQGQYVCVSPKHKLRKIISLKVRPEFSSFNFKARTHSLSYFNGRRIRSNGSNRESSLRANKNTKNPNLDEFSTTDDDKSIHGFEYGQWDVKKVKLHGENETETNFDGYHDGTTDIFRIGLTVSFAILAVIGIYRVFKCWWTGTLGPIDNRAHASSLAPYTQNNCQDVCDSNQTTITTCTTQNEITPMAVFLNDTNRNGHIANSPDSMVRRQWSSGLDGFTHSNNIDNNELPPTYEDVVGNTVTRTLN